MIIAILISAFLIGDVTAQTNASTENALEAAFLFHFAPMSWPEPPHNLTALLATGLRAFVPTGSRSPVLGD